jgi:hypothetical protein
MRIERSGPVERLTPRVEKFLIDSLGGISLDAVHSHERTRIDYVCIRSLIAVELKTLDGDPSQRTNNFVDTLRDRPDFPTFFGPVPLEAAFKNMEGPQQLRRAVLDRLGRTIVTHMKKANDQLRQHSLDYPRKNQLRILLLINEDHPEYEPQTVAWVVQRELARENDGVYRYSHIDAVVYLTERHGQEVEGRIALPICAIHGPEIEMRPWKEDVLAHVVSRWSNFNNRPLHMFEDGDQPFETIEHVPDKMPRHEMWRVEYRRQPYLKALTDEQLRDEFDEVILVTTLFGIKGSPIRLDPTAAMPAMERFTHIQIEMHDRALPMERFAFEFKRELAAAARLKLSSEVVAWLHELNEDRLV